MLSLLMAAALVVPRDVVQDAFAGRTGAFEMIDCSSGEVFQSDAKSCAERIPPCSTFKIWNTAIGLELGEIGGADELFWKWDGKKRFLEAWNRDQTLRSAFAASCVPAYQALARKTGPKRMQEWLDKIGYGDRNISAGVDVFWLPAPGRKPLLISPDEQARLLGRLAAGDVPFSAKVRAELRDVMTVRKTDRGTLYGKTGSGETGDGRTNWGWFVGYVQTAQGKLWAFACLLKGEKVMGADARAAAEAILKAQDLL